MVKTNIVEIDTYKAPDAVDVLGDLSDIEKQLLNDFQHDFPLTPTPYADIAEKVGITEEMVISTLHDLHSVGAVSRVGAVFRPHRVGASTLAAMSVSEQRLTEVAEIINRYPEVNHNYERGHHFNLWFVLTASDEKQLQAVLQDIEQKTGLEILYLPMIEDYHIDLGFPLKWK